MTIAPSLRLAVTAVLLSVVVAVAARSEERRALVGYYPSWVATPKLSDTSNAYTHVVLAFAKPNFSWNGKDWRGTGLQFESTPQDLRREIAALQLRGIKVVLAVGGATYQKWGPLAAEARKPGKITAALAHFVSAMGLDGIDVDYEVTGSAPSQIARYRAAIGVLSRAAGPGHILSLAAWSTGADCTAATGPEACGGIAGERDEGSGRERLVFRDSTLFGKIAMINVMSYDAGNEGFDPVKAWSLYRAMVPATITLNIGFQTAPESWGPARLVASNAKAVCSGAIVKADQFGKTVNKPYSVERSLRDGPLTSLARDGAMLWHIVKTEHLPLCGSAPAASPRDVEQAARAVLDRKAAPR